MRVRAPVTLLTSMGVLLASLVATRETHAQANATTSKALPNVLLLIDNSGSMERMSDGTLPSDSLANACNPGVASNPNRWGTLVQALTGNLQPYYSCGRMDRATGGALANEYSIAGQKPYDADYFLPYHRPLTGSLLANACAVGPWRLPGGAGLGVGPTNQSSMDLPAGSTADGFPSDALRKLKWTDIQSNYPGAAGGSPIADSTANACDFLQASDGQLDAARDYVRFAMMTFDNDVDPGIGCNQIMPTATTVSAQPFLGMWSYLRSTPFPYGSPSLPNYGSTNFIAEGKPVGCATATPFEVGARNWGAPPWEGRFVPFSDPLGTLNDIERTNDQIQQVIVATRPYGATPIDAMMDDARDYLWDNPKGPEWTDPYVKGGCRDQYILLLTDGAPNLAMRPNCEGPTGQCPYPSPSGTPAGTQPSIAWDIAKSLYDGGTRGHRVYTFVIGFSVNGANGGAGDGFPPNFQVAPNNNCSAWFHSTEAGGFGSNSKAMSDSCRATPPPIGSAADACCQLNEIAYFGSNGTAPPFFAESQRDLAEAFARVLARITRTASTRTIPAYSATAISKSTAADGTNTTHSLAASFMASFVPNPIKPWSGQIDRTRQICKSDGTTTKLTVNPSQGDAFDQNVAQQSFSGDRFFITVQGDAVRGGSNIDSKRSIRPLVTASTDGIDVYQATEVSQRNSDSTAPIPTNAMAIDDTTCKRSVDMSGNTIPALLKDDCAKVIWGFATATGQAQNYGGYNAWNVRCPSLGSGNKCAISTTPCTKDDDCNAVTPGDVCVPECAALGAVFRSNPVAVSPPIALSRDEGYQTFADGRKNRASALFVATTDGVLHAFKALQEASPSAKHELWSFIPPAVLPSLASNYPMGQQILLDGSPIVKDVVWDRKLANLSSGNQWHTTLVAGMGSNGPGYYALNVSDVDCRGDDVGDSDCASQYQQPSHGSKDDVSFADKVGATSTKRGPHFLWQLTDVPAATTGETLPTIRTSAPDNTNFVALFGHQSGTPALTTLYFDPGDGGGTREIGVAVLPGGSDGPPTKTGTCARALNGGTHDGSSFSDPKFDLSDSQNYPRRSSVRMWGATCDTPVAGRSVTLVRADTGEIIRHFARKLDTPKALLDKSKNIESPFDSPMIGIPIVYPSDVGTVAQKVFLGDADGTMWRIDLSDVNPANWRASLFQDLMSDKFGAGLSNQPISVPPIASLDPTGNLVLNVATGDQENLIASADKNIVVSIGESRPANSDDTRPVQASVKWYKVLPNDGERVTGPMALFDRTLYFATYVPESINNVCGQPSQQWVWGLDYVTPQDPGTLSSGGKWKYPLPTVPPTIAPDGKVNMTDPTNPAMIPGVAINQSLSCIDTSGPATADFFGMMQYGVSSLNSSGSTYSLDIPMAKPAAGGARGVQVNSVALPSPRTPTIIDSWALVID